MLDLKCVFCPARKIGTSDCIRNLVFHYEAQPKPISCFEAKKDCKEKQIPGYGWTNEHLMAENDLELKAEKDFELKLEA